MASPRETKSEQGSAQGEDVEAKALARRASSELVTESGTTSIADSVVSKIAGVAAREISGVHEMGAGTARALGAVRDKIPGIGSGPSAGITQGVSVEVGELQAAIDLDIVAEYGVSIPDLANAVRRNVTQQVQTMTGLEVTEVNISVADVFLGDDQSNEEPRVQ